MTAYITNVETQLTNLKVATTLNKYSKNGIDSFKDLKQYIRLIRYSGLVEHILLKKLYTSGILNQTLYEMVVRFQERAYTKYYAIDLHDINSLLSTITSDYFSKPIVALPIDNTVFYKNCLNLVFGMSKSGKSYSIAKQLLDAGLSSSDVIWLDRDYNVNEQMMEMLSKFSWVNKNIEDLEKRLLEMDGNGKIVVFDSLKDFTKGEDIDTNKGSQTVMQYLREFTKANYTAIVIAHATKSTVGVSQTIKIKGNSETITSKSDVVYRLNNHSEFREFEVIASRLGGIMKGDSHKLYDLSILKSKVEEIIKTSESPITVRELTNKLPSTTRDIFKTNQDTLIEVVLDGKKHIAKCR